MGKVEFIKSELSKLNIRKNELSSFYELDGKQLEDEHVNSIYINILERYSGRTIPKQLVYDVIESNFTAHYHPILELVEKPKKIISHSAIKELAATIETDTGFEANEFDPMYVERFLRKWLVNMITTALQSIDNPLLLALLGSKQGTGKTTFLRELLPDELRPYYREMPIEDGKDFLSAMSQSLIIMDDELSGKTRRELEKFKKIMSVQALDYRKPYGRNLIKAYRKASICGTGNELHVLHDHTGNRRIIPINVLAIDHKKYNNIDKIDLITESYKLFREGFNYRLNKEDLAVLNTNSAEFEYSESEIELIQRYFKPGNLDEKHELLSTTEIQQHFEFITKLQTNYVKIGKAFQKLDFKYKYSIKGNSKLKCYVIDPESKALELERAANNHF